MYKYCIFMNVGFLVEAWKYYVLVNTSEYYLVMPTMDISYFENYIALLKCI